MADGVVSAEQAIDARPGLLRSARIIVEGSDEELVDGVGVVRWVNGFSADAEPCGGGHVVDPCQLGSGADTGDSFTCLTIGPIQPYVVETSETVSTFGNASEERRQYREDRVRRKLLANRSRAIEAEFWSGTKAVARSWTNNQYLAQAAGLTILQSGAAMGIVDGLAALEQAAADGSAWERPAIHASPRLVTHWISQQLVHAIPNPPTGTLLTELGTVVIAGAGYPGTGPGGSGGVNTNHFQWAYVTPIPQVRLGQITFNDTDQDPVAIDRSTNDRTIRSMQFAAVTFSPCYRAAALVNMTTALSVPGS